MNHNLNVVYEEPSIHSFNNNDNNNNYNISNDNNEYDKETYSDQEIIFDDQHSTDHHDQNNCENIDDAMNSLHTTIIPDYENGISIPEHIHSLSLTSPLTTASISQHTYDWLLDGDPMIEDECYVNYRENDEESLPITLVHEKECKEQEKRRRKLGNDDLDKALDSMELEYTPTNSPCRSESLATRRSNFNVMIDTENDSINNGTDEDLESDPVTTDELSLESCFDVHKDSHNKINSSSSIQTNTMDKYLLLINNEKLILTPKAHNYTPDPKNYSNIRKKDKNTTLASEIGDFEYILDHLPQSLDKKNELLPRSTTPKTHSRCSNDVMDDYECILDHLPYEDPSTPEGKFFRHLKMERDQQSLDIVPESDCQVLYDRLNDVVSSEYYSADFDPVTELLHSIPWDDEYDMIQIDNAITQRLSALDEASQEVTNQLLFQINQNESELKKRINVIHAIDCDISSALARVKAAKIYLHRAMGKDKFRVGRDMISGGLQIVEESNHRDKLRSIDATLKSCDEIISLESSIMTIYNQLDVDLLLSTKEFMDTLIEKCKHLKESVSQNNVYQRLNCLRELRDRVSNLMGLLGHRVENELVSLISRGCYEIDLDREYRTLFTARLKIEKFYLLEIIENNFEEIEIEESINLENMWSDTILNAFCFEAERALARALLDPTSIDADSVQESSEFDDNLMTMRTKLNSLQAFDEDAASLRSTTKNLLSIRFEFDKRFALFPWVFHKFCSSIADIMYTYLFIMQFHQNNSKDDDTSDRHCQIQEALESRKIKLWKHCKALLVFLVESFMALKKSNDDAIFAWAHELELNHDVLKLSDQICLLGCQFIGNDSAKLCSDEDCDLRNVLNVMFEKYVRFVHVDAMTEIGTMMASDTWTLLPIPCDEENDSNLSETEKLSKRVLSLLVQLKRSETNITSSKIRPWHNTIETNPFQMHLITSLGKEGNPFAPKMINVDSENSEEYQDFVQDASMSRMDLHKKLSSLTYSNNMQLTTATQTALNGIARWTVRLLIIRQKLPLIDNVISTIIGNIYDLYFLTVFRMCIGSSIFEDIVLGNKNRSDTTFNEKFPQYVQPSNTQLKFMTSTLSRSQSFNRRRQSISENVGSNNSIHHTLVSKYLDADIHSPLISDEESLNATREFIHRAQASLSGKVNLDQIETWKLCTSAVGSDDFIATCFEKRVAASFSCLFVTYLLDTAFHTKEFCANKDFDNQDAPLLKYLNQMIHAVQHIHLLCLRLSSIRALNGRDVVIKVS